MNYVSLLRYRKWIWLYFMNNIISMVDVFLSTLCWKTVPDNLTPKYKVPLNLFDENV